MRVVLARDRVDGGIVRGVGGGGEEEGYGVGGEDGAWVGQDYGPADHDLI